MGMLDVLMAALAAYKAQAQREMNAADRRAVREIERKAEKRRVAP